MSLPQQNFVCSTKPTTEAGSNTLIYKAKTAQIQQVYYFYANTQQFPFLFACFLMSCASLHGFQCIVPINSHTLLPKALQSNICLCLCRTKVPAMLDRLRLGYEEVQIEATPRRVAVMVSHLARQQRGAEDRLRGPPAKVMVEVCPLSTPLQPLCQFSCASS